MQRCWWGRQGRGKVEKIAGNAGNAGMTGMTGITWRSPLGWGLGSCVEVVPEPSQFLMPQLPLRLGRVKVVLHVAQELHLHDMNFLHGDSRHLRPRLVRVSVVVENCRKAPVRFDTAHKVTQKTCRPPKLCGGDATHICCPASEPPSAIGIRCQACPLPSGCASSSDR